MLRSLVGSEMCIRDSSKFGWIWTSFARDSWFEGLFAVFLEDTGQTGGRDRSV